MQGGGYKQHGGFDPGLLALIATLITGGVGGYGYSKESRSSEDMAAERLRGEYEQRLRRAEAKETENAVLAAEGKSTAQKIDMLTKERDALKQQVAELKGKVESAAGPALTFQTATPQTLKAAIPKVIDLLKARYPQLVSNSKDEAAIKAVLEYPTTYQAKLERLTLPIFYAKRVQGVLAQIASKKGGRRRRGGKGKNRNTQAAVAAKEEEDWANALRAPDEAEIAEANAEARETGAREEAIATAARMKAKADLAATAQPTPVVAAPVVAAPVGSGIPTYEEFASIYEEAIRGSTVTALDEVNQRSADAKKKVDEKVQAKADAAATKAAATLADKLRVAVDKARKEVTTTSSLVDLLDPSSESTTQIKTLQSDLTAMLDRADTEYLEGYAKKGWFARGGGIALQLVKSAAEWDGVKEDAQKLLEKIQADTKTYVDTVKKQVEAEKKGVTLASRKLFILPEFKWSIGSPFAGIFEKISKSKDAAKSLGEAREESKQAILFIKDMVAKAEKLLPELKDLGYAAQEAPMAARKDRKTRIGRGRRRRMRGGATGDEFGVEMCKTLTSDERFTSGDLLWFRSNIQAILSGGTLSAKDQTVEWVMSPMDDPSKKSPRTALKALLSKLDTGIFSGTGDYLRSLTGKVQEDESKLFVLNAALAGEAFIALRCLVNDAVKRVNEKIKGETVFQREDRLRERNRNVSANNARIQETAASLQKAIETSIREKQTEFDAQGEKLRAAIGVLTPATVSRDVPPEQQDALKTAVMILQDASGALERFRMGDVFQGYLKLEEGIPPESDQAIDRRQEAFEAQKAAFEAEAAPLYAEADKAIANARRQAAVRPALLAQLNAGVGASATPAPSGPAAMGTFASPVRFSSKSRPAPAAPAVPEASIAEIAEENNNSVLHDISALLKAGADPNQPGVDGQTALMWAGRFGNDDVVKKLLGAGANVNQTDPKGMTALHAVADYGSRLSILKRLLDNNADVNAKDNAGWTPLHLAAKWNASEVINLLAEKGADIKATNKNGSTPLHVAAGRGNPKAVNALLALGADRDATNAKGKTPLDYARESNHTEVADLLQGAPSRATSEPGTPSTTPKADDTGIEMVNLGPSSAPVAAAADGPPGPGIEMRTFPPGAEGLARGATPAQAISGDVLRPGMTSPGIARQNSKFNRKGGKKSRRKSRKARKSTLKKRRGGK
jgi:hypothetical protein